MNKPVFDVTDITFGEALGIYLYAHLRIDDPRDVGQAEVVRGKNGPGHPRPFSDYAFIHYIRRSAPGLQIYPIPGSPDEFAFDLQKTLARYTDGRVDAEVAEENAAEAARVAAEEAGYPKAPAGADIDWPASSD